MSKKKPTKRPAKRVVKPRSKAPVRKVVATPVAEAEKKPKRAARKAAEKPTAVLPFGRMNYLLLLGGIGLIGLGFLLMSLDDFVDASQFSVSLYIAPVVLVAGFVEIIYAILYKPQTPADSTTSPEV